MPTGKYRVKLKPTIVFLLCIIFTGCATAPPDSMLNPQSSLLAIAVKIKQPITLFSSYPQSVLFVKIENGPDVLNQEKVISSNYSKDGHYYLLNAAPGRYAAVAAFEKNEDDTETGNGENIHNSAYNSFYFPYRIIKLSEIDVRPGEISYMGSFTLKKPWALSFSNPDEAQLYFCRMLQPHLADDETESSFSQIFFRTLCGSTDYAVAVSSDELEKDLVTELQFLNKSLDHFKGNWLQKKFYNKKLEECRGWQEIFNKRIEKIKQIKNIEQKRNEWMLIPGEENEEDNENE